MNQITDIEQRLAALIDRLAARAFREVELWLVFLCSVAALFWIALIVEIWRLLN